MRAPRGVACAGQVALVTGASSGVGRAIALALAAEGATVCLAGRDAGRLEEVRSTAGGGPTVTTHPVELARDEDVRALADRVLGSHGGLDVLVHAAAVIAGGEVQNSGLPDLDRQYQTNLRAPYALTQLVLPSLRQREGQVVFINSTQGATASAGAGQYAATKHGLRALADSLRAEVNDDGVRVLTVLLGQTATPMQEALHKSEGRPYRPETIIQPEDVADVVVNALLVGRTAQVTEVSMLPSRPWARLRLGFEAGSQLLSTPVAITSSSLLAQATF